MRVAIFFAAVIVSWQTQIHAQEQTQIHAQERPPIGDRIAKLEELLRQVEKQGSAKDQEGNAELAALSKQLDQLLDELRTAGAVSHETRCSFWKSALTLLFEGQSEVEKDYRGLLTELAAAQNAPGVHPLKWKIVGVQMKRMTATVRYRGMTQAAFDVGFEDFDSYLQAIERCADAEQAFCRSLLETMTISADDVDKRLLVACQLNGAREAYHHCLYSWANVCQRLQVGIRGGTPEFEAKARVFVYHRQAQLCELRLQLEDLRSQGQTTDR